MKPNKFIEMLQNEKLKRMGKLVTKATNDNDLSLQELREKYPEIKAKSKKEFLNKIKL